jgi:hypothetical protein
MGPALSFLTPLATRETSLDCAHDGWNKRRCGHWSSSSQQPVLDCHIRHFDLQPLTMQVELVQILGSFLSRFRLCIITVTYSLVLPSGLVLYKFERLDSASETANFPQFLFSRVQRDVQNLNPFGHFRTNRTRTCFYLLRFPC